jgi:uncharacterized membrane protein/cytochrome c2
MRSSPAPSRLFAVLLASSAIALAPRALAAGDPARGRELLGERGCTACHSLDGSPRQGPTFAGLAGRPRKVLTDGAVREVVADEDYLRRSLAEPNRDLVEGYARGSMPRFSLSDGEANDVIAAMVQLAAPAAPSPPPGSLASLAAAAIAFVGLHLALSSVPVRKRLIARLKDKGFRGLYSLVAFATFLWLIQAWRAAPYVELWSAPGWTRHISLTFMPPVFILFVCGLSTKNPTAVGQGASAQAGPSGIVRITRHPTLWSFTLWGLLHIPPNGDIASLLLFGSIAVLALTGMVHIDARRRASLGDAWSAFAQQTSVIPFAAIAAGRTRLALGEIGIARVAIGLVLFAVGLFSHARVIGISPLP